MIMPPGYPKIVSMPRASSARAMCSAPFMGGILPIVRSAGGLVAAGRVDDDRDYGYAKQAVHGHYLSFSLGWKKKRPPDLSMRRPVRVWFWKR
jgi:hypothetical protein